MNIQPATGLVFGAYLVVLLYLGARAWRQTSNLSDYILGGRRLGSWVTALSAGASDMSGWLLLGLPGYAYLAGLEAVWIASGLLVGTYLNWRLVAPRLRVYSELADDSLTLPEYLERRFADRSHLLRSLSAFFVLLFFLFYTGSGLVAGGKLFNTVFGLPYHWAVLAGAGAILLYTFLGGFLAVSWTDLLQGLLMVLALLLVPVMALHQLGGWQPAWESIDRVNPALTAWSTNVNGDTLSVIGILSLLGWGLGYFGQPHILARFMAIRDHRALPRAQRIALSWVSLSLLGAVLVGFLGIAMVDVPLAGAESETVFMVLVSMLFHPVIAGICLAAILAAIMSTADSQLLVTASAFTEDFYKTLVRPKAREAELVRTGRLAVLLFAAVALILAWDPGRKVLDLVAYAWAGFGAAFGPVILTSLYWRRMNRYGAFAGVLAGGTTVVVWKSLSGGIFDLYEIVPGVAVSFVAIILATLLTRPPDATIVAGFDQARRLR